MLIGNRKLFNSLSDSINMSHEAILLKHFQNVVNKIIRNLKFQELRDTFEEKIKNVESKFEQI